MLANMLKSLIWHERIETTPVKAKELRRYADRVVTLAKKDTLHARRKAVSLLHIRYNPMTSKERRELKSQKGDARNIDRKVLGKLFGTMKEKFATRNGGYTRILKKEERVGDSAPTCFIEFL